MAKLSAQRRLFVDEFLKDLNATAAAKGAGYSAKTATEQGYKLLHSPEVRRAIKAALAARSKRTKMDSDWVLTRLGDEALADLAELYDENGALKPINEWPLVWRQGLVSGLVVKEIIADGEKLGQVTKFTLSDRIKQIELIGRHVDVQAFADRKEITGKDGGPLKVEDVSKLEAAMLIGTALQTAAKIKAAKN